MEPSGCSLSKTKKRQGWVGGSWDCTSYYTSTVNLSLAGTGRSQHPVHIIHYKVNE